MQINILNENGAVTFYGTNPVGNSYFGEYGKSGKFYVTSNGLINIIIDKDSYQIPWEDLLVNNVVPVDLDDAIDLLSQIFSATPPSPTPLAIGDTYMGGIIFYLDGSGQHGLIRALDQGVGVGDTTYNYTWTANANGPFISTNANGTAIGTGKSNTDLILSAIPNAQSAKYCDDYNYNGYSDWYLPSYNEMQAISNSFLFPGFIQYAWTSTDADQTNAWIYDILTNGFYQIAKAFPAAVIPIRTF